VLFQFGLTLASATPQPVSKDHELKSARLSNPVGERLTAREIEIVALISQGWQTSRDCHAANRLAASGIAPFRAHASSRLHAILSAGPVPDFDDQLWG
jgi:hypothetical protein